MGDEINSKMSQLPCSGGTLLMYFLYGPSDGPRGIQPQLPTVVNSSNSFFGKFFRTFYIEDYVIHRDRFISIFPI